MTTPTDITFSSDGTPCRGWYFPPIRPAADAGLRSPCVVLGHGLGGTADSGLTPFASAFSDNGIAALTFDYRGFGRSSGHPRQCVSVSAQQEDYRAAINAAKDMAGVDPNRIVLWGASLSGGHVIELAVGRSDIAAIISLVPLVDGMAAAARAAREHSPMSLVASTARSLGATAAGVIGRPQPMVPLVGPPGSSALLSLSGYEQAYKAIAGPSWCNEIGAGIGVQLASFRPGRVAKEVTVPVLMQIADLDRVAPPHAAAKAGFAARAQVHRYPGDHFDLFHGGSCHERSVRHQVQFLNRILEDNAPTTDDNEPQNLRLV